MRVQLRPHDPGLQSPGFVTMTPDEAVALSQALRESRALLAWVQGLPTALRNPAAVATVTASLRTLEQFHACHREAHRL